MPAPITVIQPDPTPAPHRSKPKPRHTSPPKPKDNLTAEEREIIGDYKLETKTLDDSEFGGAHGGSGNIKISMDTHGNLTAEGTFECNNSYFSKINPNITYRLSATGNVTGMSKLEAGKKYRLWGKIDWNAVRSKELSGDERNDPSGSSYIEFTVVDGEKRCFISPPFAAARLTPNFVAE